MSNKALKRIKNDIKIIKNLYYIKMEYMYLLMMKIYLKQKP